jgi:tRNA A37 threonylcarbamoyladenosine dehydratase
MRSAGLVRVVPLAATHNDPFASLVRKELRKRGVPLEQVGGWGVRGVEEEEDSGATQTTRCA